MKTTRIALMLMSVLFTNKLIAQDVIEEIVVTSSFIEQNLNQIHNPIHVIGSDELASMASQSLGESLDDLVGVGTSDYGAAVGHPIIRGLGGTRVKVLNNGRVNRDVSGLGADHVVEVDFNNIQQIEVVRGPSSLFYANGSSGGIINIVDNTIARKDFTESDLTLGYEVQSVNNGNIGELSYENNFGGLNFSLGYRDTDFENYEIPYGAIIHEEHEEEEEEGHHEEEHEENPKFLPNTDSATESYKFGVSKTGDWGYLGVSARGLETHYGIPFHGEEHEEEEEEGEHEEERIFANTDSDSFNLEGSYNIKNNWLLDKVDYYAAVTEYSLKEQHAEEAHHEEEEEEEGHDHEEGPTEFKNDASEFGAVINFVSDNYSQRMMLNAIQEDVSIIGHEAFMKPSDNREFSFGYYLSRDSGLFDWHFGLRHDRISRKGAVAHHEEEEEEDHHEHEEEHEEEVDKFKKEFNTDSLALTLTRDLNDYLEMSLDLASVERAPSAIELYMNGPHLATGRYEEGDTNLKIERSRNIDFTLAYQQNVFFGSMTIFQNNIDNFIYLSDTGKKEMKMPLAQYMQKDAQLSGVELQFGAAFSFYDGDMELSFARDSVSGEFSDGAYIPRMMPARNIFSVNYKRNTLEFDMSLKDVEKQDKFSRGNPLESMTEGYQMLDMRLTQKLVTDSGRVVQASIFGKNMLDEVARNHTSWVKNEVPLPGKNVGINFRVTF
tara:strand:- start:631 stop:2787 length:2157 start_codon:yes stop_codon:yes gene_type:complete